MIPTLQDQVNNAQRHYIAMSRILSDVDDLRGSVISACNKAELEYNDLLKKQSIESDKNVPTMPDLRIP